jgi:hypothetical protein
VSEALRDKAFRANDFVLNAAIDKNRTVKINNLAISFFIRIRFENNIRCKISKSVSFAT